MKNPLNKLKLLLVFLACNAVAGEPNKPLLYITHWQGDRNGITFGFQTIPTYKYEVLGSTNLTNWYSITNFTATEYSCSIFRSSDQWDVNKQQYFKVKYEIPCQ